MDEASLMLQSKWAEWAVQVNECSERPIGLLKTRLSQVGTDLMLGVHWVVNDEIEKKKLILRPFLEKKFNFLDNPLTNWVEILYKRINYYALNKPYPKVLD